MSSDIEKHQLETLMECKGKDMDLNKYIKDLRLLKNNIETNIDFINVLKINKALSDKRRLLILRLLLEKEEMCICEFSIALNLTQPTISHHLRKLENAKLIEGVKSGKFIHYRVVKSQINKYFKLLDKLIE
ncbi:MAG: metalloregulator ArsR/SmtB family transcription factor [Candidatus Lokiarchaeota archaeon]|nr:metalloregulator ArsR/SmtB family transcription factor [Candidatus Lokiarchaeota archaeon]